MKPTLFVDVDGTVADSFSWWLVLYNRKHGTKHTIHELTEYDVSKTLQYPADEFYTNYVGVKPVPGAFDALWELQAAYRIVFATTGYGREWLRSYYLPFRDENFIHLKDKSLLCGFALIDDYPLNLDVFQGHKFLVSQPWNTNRGLNDCSWEHIARHLLEVA